MVTLRDLRVGQKQSLRKLAKKAGINFSCLWRYESGQLMPRYGNASKLALALGVGVEDVFRAIAASRRTA